MAQDPKKNITPEPKKKVLNLNLDYKQTVSKLDESKDLEPNYELSISYINNAITTGNTEPVKNQFRRLIARLQRKIDDAIHNETYLVDLEQAEIDLLKKSFRDSNFPPLLSKYVVILEEEIEKL